MFLTRKSVIDPYKMIDLDRLKGQSHINFDHRFFKSNNPL
jgi:hypothetical protein